MSNIYKERLIASVPPTRALPVTGDRRFHHFIKRAFDIIISALLLIILAPFFAFTAIVIKRLSPGPVFYRAQRMGRHRQTFAMLKFRTMYDNNLSNNGAPITSFNDPRVTPIGRWLRATKINELPQLWNVLIGDMSFVGPRPEDVTLARAWPEEVQDIILSVRPGITSPASIIYRDEEQMLHGDGFMDDYLEKILPDKQRLDMLYVRNQSLLVDVDVLVGTIAMLMPLIRKKKVDERWLYGGPTYMFFRRIVPWFLIDLVVVMFSVGLSGIVWRISTVINLGIPVFFLVSLAIGVLVSLINALMGLNRLSWRDASPSYVLDLGVSVLITMLIIWTITRLWVTEPWIPFSMIFLIGITSYLGLVMVRYRDRLISGLANRWLLFRGGKTFIAEKILIVGAGQLGELVAWLLQRSAYNALFGLVGFVDDDAHKRGAQVLGVKVIGPTKDIPRIVEKYDIDMIFYAIPDHSRGNGEHIYKLCESTPAKIVVIPDMVTTLKASIDSMTDQV